jgi:hypothetical protein
MARVIVAGGSGKVGRACIEELLGQKAVTFKTSTLRTYNGFVIGTATVKLVP